MRGREYSSHLGYPSFEEGGYTFIWWGWRTSQLNTKVAGFWTAHKDGVHFVSVVVRPPYEPNKRQLREYIPGTEFDLTNSIYQEDITKSVDEDALFATAKQKSLDRLL